MKCQSTNTNAISADVSLKSSSCHPVVEMNTPVPHAVMRIRAGLCPPFHADSPLALETCPLLAARPPAASPEVHSLTAVCCIMKIKFLLQLQTEMKERDRERGTK